MQSASSGKLCSLLMVWLPSADKNSQQDVLLCPLINIWKCKQKAYLAFLSQSIFNSIKESEVRDSSMVRGSTALRNLEKAFTQGFVLRARFAFSSQHDANPPPCHSERTALRCQLTPLKLLREEQKNLSHSASSFCISFLHFITNKGMPVHKGIQIRTSLEESKIL